MLHITRRRDATSNALQLRPSPQAYNNCAPWSIAMVSSSAALSVISCDSRVLKKNKVVEKWTVRLPVGSVADAALDPAHSSPQLGALLRAGSPPPRTPTAKTPKLTQ